MSDDLWDDFDEQGNTVNLWVTPGRFGIWCPTCALPSGMDIRIGLDPAFSNGGRFVCLENRDHHIPDEEESDD